ncbi:hypothetical protein B0T11DRAFT_8593 [Plectosphaerella cucumerina]|uniref:FAD-binding PCMH-type domain-containing protein n=1 Tax=Plectosphaerella cucumerina TaxID=40658 RepID=A0A8K0TN69_9PEZI|nr:hypothetical protein B0T11DRAFT_8593 [Plectosphaerella cucumerina]
MKFLTAAVALAAVADAASISAKDPRCICCSALTKTEGLAGKVYAPDSQKYTERLAQYYSANAAQAPWCMVFPESAEDVSKIVKVFNEHSCPFGMRSGGHSAYKGSNGIKDGVTVDFGSMADTVYDEASQIASVGPGSDWGAVYRTLAPYGVVGVGGRADVVGVGGFTTGGGYSFHTGVRGFACDNVVNFEVVLGDGSIVNANATANSDLWKALKGGSGNLGFVSRVDIEVWPSNELYASITGYSQADKPKVIDAYVDFVNIQDTDAPSQAIIAQTFSISAGYGFGAILSNIDSVVSPSFDPFFAIPSQYSIPASGPAHEVVPVFTGYTPTGILASWQAGMVGLDADLLNEMDQLQHEYISRMQAAAPTSNFEMIFQWQAVTKGIVAVSDSRGGNVLGLDTVVAKGPAVMYNIALTIDTDPNQELILPIAIQFRKALEAAADARGLNRHWEFLNYAHSSQDPISHYGAANIALLKAASKKYDPAQVFQKLRKTGFHLPA